jgi:hypothetical protein
MEEPCCDIYVDIVLFRMCKLGSVEGDQPTGHDGVELTTIALGKLPAAGTDRALVEPLV